MTDDLAGPATPASPSPCSQFRLDFEQQKKRAKDLLREAKAGDPVARRRISRALADRDLPRASSSGHTEPPSTFTGAKLADAQFAIARELRFPSWAQLKAHIALMEQQREAIDSQQSAPDAEMKTLHLRCGHDIQRTLEQAGFTGDFLPHINPYSQGPVTNTADYYEKRAQFIFDAFMRADPATTHTCESLLEDARREDAALLQAVDDYERVVLWAEHDNYDQLMLIRVLALYANTRRPRTFELIDINEFPGSSRFIGLGQLPPEALRLLWPARRPVTQEMLSFGNRAWDALRLDDPRPFAAIARMKSAPLPHLPRAARRHLQELPSVANGLGLTEQLILQAVSEEASRSINEVFGLLYIHGREPLPYMGDSGMAHVIRCMEQAAEPPFSRTRSEPHEREFRNRLAITDAGRAVLTGERDWHTLRPPGRWVGGVHIDPRKPGWRWDETTGDTVMTGER